MQKVPTLTTSSLILRPFEHTDLKAVYSYCSDPRVTQFTHWKTHTSQEKTIAWLHTLGNTFTWAITDSHSGLLLGECGLINQEKNRAEIHCALAYDHWGKGIAAQALKTIIDFSFSELSIAMINSSVIADNIRSVRLIEKLGMYHDATLPYAWRSTTTLHDVHIYSLLKSREY